MSSSASTDTFPALPADVAEVRRAAGITIAPEAALHRALQERTDELERVRAELREARRERVQPSAKALAWAASVFGP